MIDLHSHTHYSDGTCFVDASNGFSERGRLVLDVAGGFLAEELLKRFINGIEVSLGDKDASEVGPSGVSC